MSLIKLLPKTLRLAYLYVKATKTVKNDQLSISEQLSVIYHMEKACGGRAYLVERASKSSTFTLARVIGKKDMGRIFTSLYSPADAIAYLEPALWDINFIRIENKEKEIVENKLLILLYYGVAYSQEGKVAECKKMFDQLNELINAEIRRRPSDKRLNDLYKYSNKSTLNAFLDLAKKNPDLKKEAYNTCYNLLKEFESRDQGNEQLQDYINRFN